MNKEKEAQIDVVFDAFFRYSSVKLTFTPFKVGITFLLLVVDFGLDDLILIFKNQNGAISFYELCCRDK